MINKQKIAIIGVGAVGATLAYTLMTSGYFSEIVLIDTDEARATAECMDMNHCLPYLAPVNMYVGGYGDITDAAIVVITAGAAQERGESRLALVERNAKIFKNIVPRIAASNSECILLVISNPVDILTYAAIKLSGFLPSRVIGSGTVLDSARLKYLVGKKLNVDPRNVHTFIIGEHGDSELAVWSSANISGIDIGAYCELHFGREGMDALYGLFDYVKNSAYEIIKGKGATCYAIAQASMRIIRSILRDENSILSVSTLVRWHFGIENVCIGVPSVVGSDGVKSVLDIPLSDVESRKLVESAAAINDVMRSIGL